MGFSAPKAPKPPPVDNSAQIAAQKAADESRIAAEKEAKRLEDERRALSEQTVNANKARRKRSASRFALTLTDIGDTLG